MMEMEMEMRKVFELDERVGAWRDAAPAWRRAAVYVAVLAATVVVAGVVVVAIMEPLSCAGRDRVGSVLPPVLLAVDAGVVVAWLAAYGPARRRWLEGRS